MCLMCTYCHSTATPLGTPVYIHTNIPISLSNDVDIAQGFQLMFSLNMKIGVMSPWHLLMPGDTQLHLCCKQNIMRDKK